MNDGDHAGIVHFEIVRPLPRHKRPIEAGDNGKRGFDRRKFKVRPEFFHSAFLNLHYGGAHTMSQLTPIMGDKETRYAF